MFFYTIFILLLVTFGSIHLAEGIRDVTLHPKRVISVKVIFVVEVLFFVGFHILMMKFVPELLTSFPDDRCVPACYVYIVINIIVHLLRLNKENRKVKPSHCWYFKLFWMLGLALYSILLVIALHDWPAAHDGLVRAEVAYALCNVGYFLSIFFTEKEVMSTAWRAKTITTDWENKKGQQPLPFQTMYKEERGIFSTIWKQTPYIPRKGKVYDRKTVIFVTVIMLVGGIVVISWVCYLSENYSVGVQKATRSMKGIFSLFCRYFHSAYVSVRVA